MKRGKMKVVILAAASSKYFPLLIAKPKCLYHKNGVIQLERVIENVKKVVPEKDIIVVGGYKYWEIAKFLKKYPEIILKVNHKYKRPAIYSFRKAIENETEDIVFTYGDESISARNIRRIAENNRKMSILYHDNYYFYSLGIFKLRKDQLEIFQDDRYLDMNVIKEIYCFANNKPQYDGTFGINSGICIGYMIIDFIRRIGSLEKIENPSLYSGTDIGFLHYDPKNEYIEDLDYIEDTDEYRNNWLLRLYNDYVSNVIKRGCIYFKKIVRLFE